MRTLTVIGLALGMSILGAQVQAACNHGDVPYDYFNDTTSPKLIESGLTCQETMTLQAEFGGGITSPLSNRSWSWQGNGCGAAGSGLDLAGAANQLRIWGCASGTLTNGSTGGTVPY